MRKIITIIALVFAICLLLTACAQKQAPKQTQPSFDRQDLPDTPQQADTTDTQTDTQTKQDTQTDTQTETTKTQTDISQEELDELKKDLEDMEFEDLGGLSE